MWTGSQDPEFPQIKYRKLANQTFAKLEGDEKDIPHYGFYQDELVESLKQVGFKLINTPGYATVLIPMQEYVKLQYCIANITFKKCTLTDPLPED